jgi:putative ABC transport system substrate-binding protein
LFNNQHDKMASLPARYRIPSTYPTRVFADAGGLMSYGDNRADLGRQLGIYVGRILKGDKPSDLPVLQPTKFELSDVMGQKRTLLITSSSRLEPVLPKTEHCADQ